MKNAKISAELQSSRPAREYLTGGVIVFGGVVGLALCILVVAAAVLALTLFQQNEPYVQAAPPEISQLIAPTAAPDDPIIEDRLFIYQVQPGDDLDKISERLGVPFERLVEVNAPISETNMLPGHTILVPAAPPMIDAQPTPITASQPAKVLRPPYDAKILQERLINNSANWQTLWVDVQMADFGPTSYIGAPRIYHAQAWINQPGQSLELFGIFPGPVSQVHVLADGVHAERSPENRRARLSIAKKSPELIKNERLKSMLFPAASAWLNSPGRLQVGADEQVAGRKAISAAWINVAGEAEARLWIDAATGLVLRLQEYGGPGRQTLLSDTMVTAIELDQDPPSVFGAGSVWGTKFFPDHRAQPGTDARFSLVLPYSGRTAGPVQPLPPDFQSAASRLSFLYPAGLTQLASRTGKAEIPINLLGDGYLLGETDFGLPWGLQCERSPNGERIAFNTITDGVAQPDPALRWLNLSSPSAVFQPLPDFSSEYFVFSPDSQFLAVFGRETGSSTGSISVLELATGERRQLVEIWQATSLVWSPDGKQIAFIGQEPGQQAALYFLHVRLADVLHSQTIDYTFYGESGWRGELWETALPRSMGDMDQCAATTVR